MGIEALPPVEWEAMFSMVGLSVFMVFVVELFVLVRVGAWIGALNTVVAVVLVSMLGFALVKARSGRLVQTAVSLLSEGKVDTDDLADRSISLFSGFLLVIPGFVTAVAGLLLFLPPIRALVRPMLSARLSSSTGLDLRFGSLDAQSIFGAGRGRAGTGYVDVDESDNRKASSDNPTDTPTDPPSSSRLIIRST